MGLLSAIIGRGKASTRRRRTISGKVVHDNRQLFFSPDENVTRDPAVPPPGREQARVPRPPRKVGAGRDALELAVAAGALPDGAPPDDLRLGEPMSWARVADIAAPLERVVADLRPGMLVRVDLHHSSTPTVGLVRKSGNHVLRTESQMLFLDTPAGHILRDSLGRPGHLVRGIVVLDETTALDDEEKYDLLAALMREYTDLVMARRVAHRDTAAGFLLEQDVAALKARIEQLLSGWFGGAL